MKYQDTLPVAWVSGHELPITGRRTPVWPIQSEDDLRALQDLARVFSARLEEVPWRAGEVKVGRELVVGLGEGVSDAARLYAHLTRRRFVAAADLRELRSAPPASVVVTTPVWLSNEFLSLLQESPPRSGMTGIVCAGTQELLRRQTLLKSAAAALHTPAETHRVDIMPTVPLGRRTWKGREMLGERAAGIDLRSALGKGAGVLTIQTHFDGLDAYLGPAFTLCGMDSPPQGLDEERSPRCRLTNFCHRYGDSVERTLKAGVLLPPEVISARVFVWDVCKGVLPRDGVLDSNWGLIHRLLASHTIGALITSWEVVLTSPNYLEPLLPPLVWGEAVGRGLKNYLRSKAARQTGRRMCLFGDPRVRANLTRVARRPALSRRADGPPPVSESHALRIGSYGRGRVNFPKALLVEALPKLSDEQRRLCVEALAHISVYESGLTERNRKVRRGEDSGKEMRRAALRFFFQRGCVISKDWVGLAEFYNAIKQRHCFGCGTPANTLVGKFHEPAISRRRLMICPHCGVVEDAPTRSSIKLAFQEEEMTARIGGLLPRSHWDAGLMIQSKLPSDNLWLEWPSRTDGSPAESLLLRRPLPAGPLDLAFFLMSNEDIAIVSQPAYGKYPEV